MKLQNERNTILHNLRRFVSGCVFASHTSNSLFDGADILTLKVHPSVSEGVFASASAYPTG